MQCFPQINSSPFYKGCSLQACFTSFAPPSGDVLIPFFQSWYRFWYLGFSCCLRHLHKITGTLDVRMFHFISISWNAADVPVWYINRSNSNPKFAAEVRWPSPFLRRWCHHTLSSSNACVKAGNTRATPPKYRLAYCACRCSTGRIIERKIRPNDEHAALKQ